MSIIFSWDRIRFLKIIQSELALHPKTYYSILISNKDRGLFHETIIHRLEGSRSRPDISILMESSVVSIIGIRRGRDMLRNDE